MLSMQDLKALALTDPVQAYMLVKGFQKKPVVFNMPVSFSSLALNQNPITVPTDQTFTKRTWFNNTTFEVYLPNAFIGSVFQPSAMADLKANPGIAIRLASESGPRFLVTNTFTPLQNFVNMLNSNWLNGWQIQRLQQLIGEFTLTNIPFGDSSNAPPYNMTLTFNGFQFDDLSCDSMDDEEAQEALCRYGFLTQKSFGEKSIFIPT